MLRKSRFVLLGALLSVSIWAVIPVHAASPSKNPCAAKNPCAGNPCAAQNPCAPSNPCAAQNPGAAKNPCAAKNACARTEKSPRIVKPFTPSAGGKARAGSKAASITHPPYSFTRKRDVSVKDAVARGRKIFRSIGCVGCHPRGRTIRGTVVDVTGARHPVPVPHAHRSGGALPAPEPCGPCGERRAVQRLVRHGVHRQSAHGPPNLRTTRTWKLMWFRSRPRATSACSSGRRSARGS